MNHANFAKPYEVTSGKKFRLKDYDPGDTHGLKSKEEAAQVLEEGIQEMSRLQDLLYADNRWALLLIFQAMDAAGKDSAIKHVMSGVNPQGCQVFSFKSPSQQELDHDFLWRTTISLPERGRIGIFNRSYYEEVLVVRVHPELLEAQNIPEKLVQPDRVWKERFEDIRSFEQHLARNGTVVRKFFLNVSKDEQRQRFLKRLEEPDKNWKFEARDLREREHWDEYMDAYEEAIGQTSTPESPWYVVPADHKWFTRVVVASVIVQTLESLNLCYPKLEGAKKKELAQARKELLAEK
jgi:PPK2 family polyphosphate:nucleotide phosphotransferase